MRIYDNGIYRDLTAEELAAREKEANRTAIAEKSRPLTEAEVSRMLIAQQVNSLVVDDNTASRMAAFYPAWENGTAYAVGFKVSYGGKLWRCLQGHTAQVGWEPENVASLWEQVCFHHSGTEDDPIPYEGNMRLENGKHYIQQNAVYRCIRDSGNPVYHTLAELVGLYVEEA